MNYAGGASILANRYTYGAGAPLDYTDPDGHWPSCNWCTKVGNALTSSAKWVGNELRTGYNAAKSTVKKGA
ncbi:hypothetical protein NGM37_10010, partial [Streptomyces sp. TRM76130]|nr:hypothetical protein [Streptomyces sp. TRM76130]